MPATAGGAVRYGARSLDQLHNREIEATKARATPEFFARHSIADLDGQDELWLGQQGRITHPLIKKPGGTHYQPISWSAAYELIADRLNALASPDVAPVFEVVFLNGVQEPFVDQMDTWTVDGIEFKVRLDYGVGAVDYRGGVRNAGA